MGKYTNGCVSRYVGVLREFSLRFDSLCGILMNLMLSILVFIFLFPCGHLSIRRIKSLKNSKKMQLDVSLIY